MRMPKKNYVHLCIVLDASGSMRVIEDDIKGSFKTFMAEQKREEGKTVFDVFQFADRTSRIVKHADMAEYTGDLMSSYRCDGMTALHDAVCKAIDTIGAEFAAMPEEERPEKVIFTIVTDGHENASRKFSLKDVKERIDRQTNEYSWEFVYLAANQDEFEARRISSSMGVCQSMVSGSMADLAGTTCQSLRRSVRDARAGRRQDPGNAK
jgi:Mg-chelatase subunit ChlD